jgi:tetratricopeptide (TPR) repeat protein
MQVIRRYLSTGIAAVSIGATAMSHVAPAIAQDLVAISSITGGSSVFVFRNVAKAVKRTIVTIKPTFTKAQRVETAKRVKRQYEQIAKVAPRRPRAPQVDPVRNPLAKSLPPAQGAIRFAGVGEFYLAKGDIDLSLAAFRDALELDETNKLARSGYSDALVARGNDLLSKDEAAKAKPMFLEALKFDPANAPAFFGLAEAYSELNETADAIANYEKALESDPKLTEIYVPLGILYYQSGNVPKADELLSKAIAASPNAPEVQLFLGLVRAAQSRDEDALVGFTKAKTLDPTNVDAFFNSAETLVRLKRLEAAIPDYEKTIALKRDHFDAWFGLGEIYLSLGNQKKAIEAYSAASKLKNNDWEVFAGLAESYRLNKDYQLAKANFNLAEVFLTQKPNYDKAKIGEFRNKIGLMIGQECDILQQKNIQCDWASAIDSLQSAAERTQDPVDYVNLGWAYFRSGHRLAENKELEKARPFLENARKALQKAVSAGPPAEDFALQNLASVYIDLGDNKLAIETLSRLIQKKPELNFARYALGVAYFRSNDFANAEKWFRGAIDNESSNITYYMALGNALISRKDSKGLRALIERLKPLDAAAADELDKKRQAFRM